MYSQNDASFKQSDICDKNIFKVALPYV